MTTDRDRLAADLRDAAGAFADDPAAYLDRGDAYDAMADRLIALGWHKGLDEERLARALRPYELEMHEGDEFPAVLIALPADEAAAAIAKAYTDRGGTRR